MLAGIYKNNGNLKKIFFYFFICFPNRLNNPLNTDRYKCCFSFIYFYFWLKNDFRRDFIQAFHTN